MTPSDQPRSERAGQSPDERSPRGNPSAGRPGGSDPQDNLHQKSKELLMAKRLALSHEIKDGACGP